MLFPMYVVAVPDFMAMVSAQPHEWLKAAGVVRQWEDTRRVRVAAFVSHQWCGRGHPDPEFAQLRVLQGAIAGAASGTLKVEKDLPSLLLNRSKGEMLPNGVSGVMSWSLWYDYFSVPQMEGASLDAGPGDMCSDISRAIASLHRYVEACAVFLVLAPTLQHEAGNLVDYQTWKTRGWCRFERLARAMRHEGVIVVRRADAVTCMGLQDYIFEPVGTGAFAREADKSRLSGIVRELIADRLGALASKGREAERLYLSALVVNLVAGLPPETHACASQSLDSSFSERLGRAATRPVHGTTPLLLASRAGDVQAMRALIRARASLDCVERRQVLSMSVVRGHMPLHVASSLGAVSLLLRARADACARARLGSTPLHTAGKTGRVAVLEALLEHRAALEAPNAFGQSPLDVCVCWGRLAGVEALLATRASVESTAEGIGPLHQAALFGSGPEIVRSLLSASASLESCYSPRCGSTVWVLYTSLSISYRLGYRSQLRSIAYHSWDATPLMLAVLANSWAEALVMVEHRADPDVCNRRGASARTLARDYRAGWVFEFSGLDRDSRIPSRPQIR